VDQYQYLAPNNYVVCDWCGCKRRPADLKKTWDGFHVCAKHWEPRHPQDYVRNIREPDPKVIGTPQPEPQFTAEALALPMPPNPLGL
jgi:hypothetical protein